MQRVTKRRQRTGWGTGWGAALTLYVLLPLVAPSDPCPDWTTNIAICDPDTDGTTFLRCVFGTPFRYDCPAGLLFNQAIHVCDFPENIEVMCVADGSSSPTTSDAVTTTTSATPADTCSDQTCHLPQCRCVGTDIPGHLPASQVPQMVLLTFDDGVNAENFPYYEDLFLTPESVMRNPNNCPIGATFFVSNDNTNLSQVRTLWDNDHEVASHSLTRSYPLGWNSATWRGEMQGMRMQLAQALGVPVYEIHGMRTPFLFLGDEMQFAMMQEENFTYDTSMLGGSLNVDTATDPVWPFTLHYPPDRTVCSQVRCPTSSYPQVWEVPLLHQYSPNGQPCFMTGRCSLRAGAGPDGVSAFLRQNFQRHYGANRAPFMISLHATWFDRVPGSLQGLKDFLKEMEANDDVWMVTVTQMLDWVRHPVLLDDLHVLPSWGACV